MSLRLEVKEAIEKEDLRKLNEMSRYIKEVEKFKELYYTKVQELINICCFLNKNELRFGFNFYKKVYNNFLIYLEGSDIFNQESRDSIFEYVLLRLKEDNLIVDISDSYLEHIYFSEDGDEDTVSHCGYLNVKFFTISNILNSNTNRRLSANNNERTAFTKLIFSRKDEIMNKYIYISKTIKKDIINHEKTEEITEWETWEGLGYSAGLFCTEGSKIEDFIIYLYFLEREFIKIKVTPIYRRKIRNYNGMIYWEGLTRLKDMILNKRIKTMNIKFEVLT